MVLCLKGVEIGFVRIKVLEIFVKHASVHEASKLCVQKWLGWYQYAVGIQIKVN